MPIAILAFLVLVLGTFATGLALAQPLTIPLWPEGVPDLRADAAPERIVDGRVSNVHWPSLTYYPPASGTARGTAVIVCPGGGYVRLAIDNEGAGLSRRLNDAGVAAFVLKYRLVEYGHPAPLRDVLRAIRLVRSRAAEFGLRPAAIGVFGASAGGHLAASAATLYDDADGRTGAPLDAVSARPDFVGLLYPVITFAPPHAHQGSRRSLLGERPDAALVRRLSLDTRAHPGMPPVFMVHTAEDASVPVENSLLFYAALRAVKVPVEMHLYQKGAHGFGLTPGLGPTSDWTARLDAWMRGLGY